MENIVIDATVAAQLCVSNSVSQKLSEAIGGLNSSHTKIWIYVPEINQILNHIVHSDEGTLQDDPGEFARCRLLDLSENCQWLSGLAEDAVGLTDKDPIAVGLVLAAQRLSGSTVIVTECASRLSRGKPFTDVDSYCLNAYAASDIQFIDLGQQQDKIRGILERNVQRVLHHGSYVFGSEIVELQERLAEFVGVEHCICVSSGTDAILVAMMSIDVGSGDEVITTPFTFFAAVEIIKLLGAKPVYVDIDPGTYTLNPAHLETAITDRTRAILPVSLYGQCAEMDSINEIAASHKISVIEDAAQSFGATYKGSRSCGLSEIGCTSFFPAKPLGGYGDGGACFTNNTELAERMLEIRNHGQTNRYVHERLGINGRMDTLQAAILLAKLEIFDEELTKRSQIAERYSELLNDAQSSDAFVLPQLKTHNISSWAQYTIEVSNRSFIQKSLSDKSIPTAIHYPYPVYKQKALLETVNHCIVSERASKRVLSLPMHPYLDPKHQAFISSSLITALQS